MDTDLLKYITADTVSGLTGVLCTIIEAHGSSPREAGTSMWVTPDIVRGTVGGGVAEHEVIKKAREMLKSGDFRKRSPYMAAAENKQFRVIPYLFEIHLD